MYGEVTSRNHQGRVARGKPVNANPGLKDIQSINFSCIRMFFTAYVLCSLILVKLKLKEKQNKQKTSPVAEKLQNLNKIFSPILG